MTLSEKQRRFTAMLVDLIAWANSHGFEVVIAEVARTLDQQKLYVKQGKAKTLKSGHLNRLAADLLLFKNGVYLTKTEEYAELGHYWKHLDTHALWGGDWGWDGGHFEYEE